MVRLIQQPAAGVDLLDQYRQCGSPELFAQIMRAYGGMVLSVCYKVTKDAADAEDASQATFLTLAVQCKTGAPIQFLGPWLKKVAKRTSLDLVRSRKRRTRRETVTAENRPEHYDVRPGAAPEADEQGAILRAELDQLPSKYRMPLVLHYFGGLSHDQISKEMKCTTAALGVRLHRARKMLGKRLSARGISLEGAALGVAITAAVTHVLTDRFLHSTQAALIGLTTPAALGHHVVVPSLAASGVMTPGLAARGGVSPLAIALPHGTGGAAALPDNFAAVLQLVHQVGQSMARARLRMATLVLAASITLLGGAAEAVRHLPESIRPNLDFLSPARLLQDLFDDAVPVPHAQATPRSRPTLAKGGEAGSALPSTFALVPTPAAAAAAPLVVNQPVLALQWPTPVAVPPTPGPMAVPKLTLTTMAQARPAVGATMAAAATPRYDLRSRGGDGGRVDGGDSPPPAADTASSAAPTAGRPGGAAPRSIGGPGGPDATDRPSLNVPRSQAVHDFQASAVGGETIDHAAATDFRPPVTGPLPLPTGDDAFVPDSVIVRNGDVFVHAGTGKAYHWADPLHGILAKGTNAVDFDLKGVDGQGLVAIERLPVTTTIAPSRPTGHHFVGIWSFDTGLPFDSVTLTPHYDVAMAESLGLQENVLKLWVYDDRDGWRRIMDGSFSRDLGNHTLTGTFSPTGTTLRFFAVSAPEPAILGVLAIGSYGLLRRRRGNVRKG